MAFLQILILGNMREAKVVPGVTQMLWVVTERSVGDCFNTYQTVCAALQDLKEEKTIFLIFRTELWLLSLSSFRCPCNINCVLIAGALFLIRTSGLMGAGNPYGDSSPDRPEDGQASAATSSQDGQLKSISN